MRSHLHVESEKSELTEAESRLVVPEVGGGAQWVKVAKRHKLPICKQVIGMSSKGRKRFYTGNIVS